MEKEKPPIFGMFERGGQVVIQMLANVQQATIAPLIQTTIASAVEEQAATMNEISNNSAEAAKGSSDIAQNILSVSEAAQSSSEAAGRTSSSAAGTVSEVPNAAATRMMSYAEALAWSVSRRRPAGNRRARQPSQ